ncbi:MAG: PqqD family protein [Acidobacteria bacterium]|nr:PqqD family protein [Acidobacteriota bacterium]MBU4307239.1 PqqD family protein [Acidobacteriota bacterium]MBU4405031.1 PqqD family protein [Acidobacteriota bacterium]MCG2811474.1 PqqD family protein [Candidatus Aminicenantes bacterium]
MAREIEGELILIPIAAGVGDIEESLFTLNETGRAIWGLLDGRRSLGEITSQMTAEYNDSDGQIKEDVLGLVSELAARSMIVRK